MRFYGGGLSNEVLRRWEKDYDRGQRRAIHRMFRATPTTWGEALAPALGELNRPALVIWGERNRFIPTVQAARQRESFPRARVEVVPGSGHYPHLDAPAAVAAHVVPFLERTVAEAAGGV